MQVLVDSLVEMGALKDAAWMDRHGFFNALVPADGLEHRERGQHDDSQQFATEQAGATTVEEAVHPSDRNPRDDRRRFVSA